MKVGILTFHRGTNFGTVLQAFATEKGIKKLGVDSQIIDYRLDFLEDTMTVRKYSSAKSIKDIVSITADKVLYPGMASRRIKNYNRFYRLMDTSNKICTTPDEVAKIAQDYDVVLSGSDQLFNKRITRADNTFFLPFEHKRKVTFASSFGESELPYDRILEIAPYFSDFDSLSVREKTAENILKEIKKVNPDAKSATTVLDPTFLLTKDEWNEYANDDVKLPKDGYILAYYMLESELCNSITKALQKKTGLPVVNIKPTRKQILRRHGKNYAFCGPAEFLACYKNASYVVTNSFHGTAFSIHYGIPFFSSKLPNFDLNSRQMDLCNLLDLSHRWIDSEQKLKSADLTKPFEKDTNKIIEKLREHSFDYLKDALGI